MSANGLASARITFLTLATLVAASSAQAWTSSQPVKGNIAGQVENVQVIGDGSGGTFTCWQDKRYGNYDVFVQRLGTDGLPVFGWPSGGLDVSPVLGDQVDPRIVLDGSGGVIVCWDDARHNVGGKDIYAQRLTSAGALASGWTPDGVPVCNASGDQDVPHLVSDNASGAVIVWRDLRSVSVPKYFAQRMSGAGAALWAANGVAASPGFGEGDPFAVDLAPDPSSGVIISYVDAYARLIAQRLAGNNGAWMWNPNPCCGQLPGVLLSSSAANGGFGAPISLAPDGQSGAYIAYMFISGNPVHSDIYLHHVDYLGNHWADNGTAVCTATLDQLNPRVASDGDGAVVSWLDYRANLTNNPDVYAVRVTSLGGIALCWASNGAPIVTGLGLNLPPVIATDGRGGAVIGWQTNANVVSGRRVSKEGIIDAVVTVSTAGQLPSVTRVGYGKAVLAWKDGRFASPPNAIYAQELAYTQDPMPGPPGPSGVGAQTGLTTAIVMWTTPADDPNFGPIQSFEVRYSNQSINDGNFFSATFAGTVSSQGAGTSNCLGIGGLNTCSPYYYAVKGIYASCGYTQAGTAYRATRCNGSIEVACEEAIRIQPKTDATLPTVLKFVAPSPNPAVDNTELRYDVPASMADSRLEIAVYDVMGRRVRLIEDGTAKAGRYSTTWDLQTDNGARVETGMYFVRFTIGDVRQTRTVMIRR